MTSIRRVRLPLALTVSAVLLGAGVVASPAATAATSATGKATVKLMDMEPTDTCGRSGLFEVTVAANDNGFPEPNTQSSTNTLQRSTDGGKTWATVASVSDQFSASFTFTRTNGAKYRDVWSGGKDYTDEGLATVYTYPKTISNVVTIDCGGTTSGGGSTTPPKPPAGAPVSKPTPSSDRLRQFYYRITKWKHHKLTVSFTVSPSTRHKLELRQKVHGKWVGLFFFKPGRKVRFQGRGTYELCDIRFISGYDSHYDSVTFKVKGKHLKPGHMASSLDRH